VGICSWADRSLAASDFYPRGVRDGASRLSFYSGTFDTVEADSPFYAPLNPSAPYLWAGRTPRGFLFGVKVFGLFTFHSVRPSVLPRWARDAASSSPEGRVRREDLPPESRRRLFEEFLTALEPLSATGKLGYLLFQFPPWFRFGQRELIYLSRVRQVCGPRPVAVEVRHSSWFLGDNRGRFLDRLGEENLAYTAVDEPQLSWTVGPDWPLTASWGTLVRFHGRNVEAWSRRGAPVSERYNWAYRDEELRPWRDRIRRRQAKCPRLFVMFNNCVGDRSVRSARRMQVLLGLLPPEEEPLQGGLGFVGETG
jgi:uncharacterized protein YecE (DUF72 family)